MPRFLKRLTLAFAVLSIGLVLSGFITLRVLANRVMTDDTEPVRVQLAADWAKNADTLEAQLATAAIWSTPTGRTPASAGCQLRWTGESPAVQQHLARCPNAPPPLELQTLTALDDFKDQLLVKVAEAPNLERDFSWMAALHGQDDWSQVTGTPLEFVDAHEPVTELPVLALRQVRGVALLRLIQGQRAGDLDAAAADVTALARALLGRPFLIDQLVGVAILDRSRALLDAVGRPELGPDAQLVKALRGARLASAMLWHPWVPKAQRERFLPKLSGPSRCAAASETLVVLELGPLLHENYPEFAADFLSWKGASPCSSDFVKQALDARATVPEGTWKKMLESAQLVGSTEHSGFFSSLLLKVIESTSLGRKTVTELILSVIAAKPFPSTNEQQP